MSGKLIMNFANTNRNTKKQKKIREYQKMKKLLYPNDIKILDKIILLFI